MCCIEQDSDPWQATLTEGPRVVLYASICCWLTPQYICFSVTAKASHAPALS